MKGARRAHSSTAVSLRFAVTPCRLIRGGTSAKKLLTKSYAGVRPLQVELPLPCFREPVRVPSPALERAALLADCVPAPMISDEWDPGALHASYEVGEGISLFREHYHALAGEPPQTQAPIRIT